MSDLFIAGVIPGLLIGALLMVYSFYYCKKNGEDQQKKEAMVGGAPCERTPQSAEGERVRTFKPGDHLRMYLYRYRVSY